MKAHRNMGGTAVAALMSRAKPLALVGSVRNDGFDPAKIEALLKDVKAELTRVGDDVKKTAENALKEAKDAGVLGAETKAKADEALTAQAALTNAHSKLEGKLEAITSNLTELEQRVAARRGGGDEKPKSMGEQFVASEEYKAFVTAGGNGRASIKVKNAITSASGSGGGLIWSERESEIVGMPKRQMTIRQLLMVGRTGSNLIEYAKQTTRTNNARPVTEGEAKPSSSYGWTQTDAAVRTIAHWVPVSKQAMDDAAQLQGEIDGELRYGLDLAEEDELLNGDGTGQHLDGLINNATAYSAPITFATGYVVTMIDTLRLGILQASLSEYPADGLVLHPTDWARIELTKDDADRYIFANVMQMAGPQLWGRPVVSTQAITEDDFLVGAFKMAGKIYDREEANVLISSEDQDNFIKNMLTVRAEKRLALAVKRPAALIYGEFGN